MSDESKKLVNFHADVEQLRQFDKVAKDHKLDRTELLNAFIGHVAKDPSPVQIKVYPGRTVKLEKKVLIKTVEIKIDTILL